MDTREKLVQLNSVQLQIIFLQQLVPTIPLKFGILKKEKMFCSIDAQHTDIVQACDWNRNGSLIITSCKDKKN